MPQIAPIVLTDSTSTNVTFSPLKNENGQVTFVNRTDGQPALDKTITLSLKKQGNGNYRAVAKISMPVIQVVDGISVVVDTDVTEVNFRTSRFSASLNRADQKSLLDSLVANSAVTTVLTTLEGMY